MSVHQRTHRTILVTLVIQGLPLPALIRRLGLAGASDTKCEEEEARRLVLEAALKYLDESRDDSPAFTGVYDDLAQQYRHRLASLNCAPDDADGESPGHYYRYLDVSRDLLKVQRETALRLRSEARISDEVLREIETDLDLNAIRLNRANDRRGG